MVTGSSDMDYRNLAAQFEGSYLSYKGDYIRAS